MTGRGSDRDLAPMTTRLRPMVTRRGFTPGSAPRRLGNLAYVLLLALACAGFTMGTIAIADDVRALVGSR